MKAKILLLALVSQLAWASGYYSSSGGGGGGPDVTSIARDGSRPPTADQPWGGFDLTSLGSTDYTQQAVAPGAPAASHNVTYYKTDNKTLYEKNTAGFEKTVGWVRPAADSICMGENAGTGLTSAAIGNICIGTNVCAGLTTGVELITAVGEHSAETAGNTVQNVAAFGAYTGQAFNVAGGDFAGFGQATAYQLTTGNRGSFFGSFAAANATTQSDLGCFGYQSCGGGGISAPTAGMTAIGTQATGNPTTSCTNFTGVGYRAGFRCASADNTFVGYSSGPQAASSTGARMTCVGSNSCNTATMTGGNIVCLGENCEPSSASATAEFNVGSTTAPIESNKTFGGYLAGIRQAFKGSAITGLTNLKSIAMADNSVYIFQIVATGIKTDFTKRIAMKVTCSAYRSGGGSAAFLDGGGDDGTVEYYASSDSSYRCRCNLTGSTFLTECGNDSGDSVNWVGIVNYETIAQ